MTPKNSFERNQSQSKIDQESMGKLVDQISKSNKVILGLR